MSYNITGATYASPESWNKVTKVLQDAIKNTVLLPMTVDEIISDTYFGNMVALHESKFDVRDGAGYQIRINGDEVISIVFGTRRNSFDATDNVSADSRYIEVEHDSENYTIYVYIIE